jgi:hypothetical protein
MTYFTSPAVVASQHIKNQKLQITHVISATRPCNGHRYNGRRRSIAQFYDQSGNPTKTLCKLCRGVK